MSTDLRARAWIEVNAAALCRNLRRIREAVGDGPALIPMVKADAYGLGIAGAVRALELVDPWGYGVATVEEGTCLRELGVRRPILVSSPVPPDGCRSAVEHDLIVSVSDLEVLDCLVSAAHGVGRSASFHVEIDTGMGRAGFDWREAATWGLAVAGRASAAACWTGCFTHFHSADLPERGPSEIQWERFQDALAALPVPRERLMIHAANSAAALRFPAFAAGGVRPGIFLYGGAVGVDLPLPEPVASVRARVVRIRDATPGSTVGYGATHAARAWERWATLAIGYGDGLPRALGNRGWVIVGGRRVPIIGRISMDVTVVDITGDDSTRVGDVATLIGADGDQYISVEEVAALAGTISYEILTGFTARLPRIWSGDGSH
ncbi:MAG: alanine racemase [Gemmatimonadetes bacterium]|nr:alanine racemase [Gemmatimonadota bacterium]